MYVCMYVCRSRILLSKMAETFLRGKVAMVPWGKEGLLCVTASVNRLGGAAKVCKFPFLAFTVHSVLIPMTHFTEPKVLLAPAM
jgi:hypothetical protein